MRPVSIMAFVLLLSSTVLAQDKGKGGPCLDPLGDHHRHTDTEKSKPAKGSDPDVANVKVKKRTVRVVKKRTVSPAARTAPSPTAKQGVAKPKKVPAPR